VRLDHLLSKEQLAQAFVVCGAVASPPANVRWGVLKGGTSIVGADLVAAHKYRLARSFGGGVAVERGWWVGWCL
jgi:hypothetical protein